MKVGAEVFTKACHMLDLVPMMPMLPSSVFIGFRKGGSWRLSSTLGASVQFPEMIEVSRGALDRRILFPFVFAGTSDRDYEIEFEKERVLVRQGRRKVQIRKVPVDWNYGDWTEGDKVLNLKLFPELVSALECAVLCATNDPILLELNCVYMEFADKLRILASNDLVMCCGTTKGLEMWNGVSLAFPLALVPVIKNERLKSVAVRKGAAKVTVERAQLWGQVPQKAEREFPKKRLRNLLAQARKSREDCCTMKMGSLVRVCELFSKYLTNLPRTEWELIFETGERGVAIRANTTVAEFQDMVTADVKKTGVKMGINLAVLGPIVALLKGKIEHARFAMAGSDICYLAAGGYEFLLSQKG